MIDEGKIRDAKDYRRNAAIYQREDIERFIRKAVRSHADGFCSMVR